MCCPARAEGNFFSLRGPNTALNFRGARENFIKNSSDFTLVWRRFPLFCGFWRQARLEVTAASGDKTHGERRADLRPGDQALLRDPWHRARSPRRWLAARDAP